MSNDGQQSNIMGTGKTTNRYWREFSTFRPLKYGGTMKFDLMLNTPPEIEEAKEIMARYFKYLEGEGEFPSK